MGAAGEDAADLIAQRKRVLNVAGLVAQCGPDCLRIQARRRPRPLEQTARCVDQFRIVGVVVGEFRAD